MVKSLSVCLLFLSLITASCYKTPFPCFTVSEREDSVPVNKKVYFNAICSDHAKEFFWSLPKDSVAYSELVTYVFRDTGQFRISLLVGNGNRSRSLSKNLRVVL